jgi:type IV secretion system protein TrbF
MHADAISMNAEELETFEAGTTASSDPNQPRASRRRGGADADLANPYLAARSAWDERYGDLISRAKHWRSIAFVAMTVAVLAVCGLIIAVRQARLVPFVIAVSDLGRPIASGVATPEMYKVEERVMKATVADFVTAWRSVTLDWTFQKAQIDKVFAEIGQGSRAQVAIQDWYRSDPPQKRAQEGTVEVEIQSVLGSGDKSWEVQWTETKRLENGQLQGKETYRGILTVAVNPPHNEDEVRQNPLGVFVTNATWARVFTK